MSTQAFINHRVLKWARERRDITEAAVAKRLGTSPSKVRSWEAEDGEAHPTLRQAQNIAGILNVPLGYLFLSEPPSLTTELPDLRTVSGDPVQNPSPELLDQLYDVLRKQSWYREYRESQLVEPLPFVARFSIDDTPEAIALGIAASLGIDDEMRRQSVSWQAFLTAFVRKAEAAGILVFRSGIVESNTHRPLSVKEFRGFAIADDLAPAVFINAKDAKVAQTFTLAHELAHLWIGESGVSNPNYAIRADEQPNQIDRLCDKVATEVLVPEADFLNRWSDSADTDSKIRTLSAHYRVSRFVVLRRAYETGEIGQAEFQVLYDEFLDDYHEPSGEGGNFYNLFLARNSSTLTHTLLNAAAEGQIAQLDAARLLNVRVETLQKARKELFGGA